MDRLLLQMIDEEEIEIKPNKKRKTKNQEKNC